VSALDVSVQAQVLNLLEDLKVKYGISLVFIAHDLGVVKNISDRVVVMYLGRVCEVAPPDELFARPLHPYSAALMSSIPVTDPAVDPRAAITIGGELPSPVNPPSGCRFRTRCPNVIQQCVEETPELRELRVGQFVACHNPVQEYVSPAARIPTGDAMWAPADRVGADASGSTLSIADR
jgi:peptide/nickel transport system ATP-binding protein